ncbi:40S ribosomal protein S7 [Hyalella azteca]|uniref:40S ribosomal protein S7 n=1 Tax=Hyalella azteca TaxID=294128 RepID=A0A8B7NAI8_HYAAZ|nr:40S ribosomal protein S7 [Hyalella azteca]
MPVFCNGKITKRFDEPDEFETSIGQTLMDLETNSDLKDLRDLTINGAKQIDVGEKKCIALFVPVPLLKQFQRVQQRLVRELEKKFSGKHVVIIAQRRILPKEKPNMKVPLKQKRPMSRTLTSVHSAILDDLVYPAEIVGKRIRVRLDGSRLYKVHLDKSQQTNIEHKVETFSAVYKRLTGKEVTFEFRESYF